MYISLSPVAGSKHTGESGLAIYQYGPTGSVDREFVDIMKDKKRRRGKE